MTDDSVWEWLAKGLLGLWTAALTWAWRREQGRVDRLEQNRTEDRVAVVKAASEASADQRRHLDDLRRGLERKIDDHTKQSQAQLDRLAQRFEEHATEMHRQILELNRRGP